MDRTVKVLLAVIAVALWGLLLRPFLSLPPAQAEPSVRAALTSGASAPAVTLLPNTDRALIVQNGTVYEVDFSGRQQIRPSALRVAGSVRLK